MLAAPAVPLGVVTVSAVVLLKVTVAADPPTVTVAPGAKSRPVR
jgi:hypothetical protein